MLAKAVTITQGDLIFFILAVVAVLLVLYLFGRVRRP